MVFDLFIVVAGCLAIVLTVVSTIQSTTTQNQGADVEITRSWKSWFYKWKGWIIVTVLGGALGATVVIAEFAKAWHENDVARAESKELKTQLERLKSHGEYEKYLTLRAIQFEKTKPYLYDVTDGAGQSLGGRLVEAANEREIDKLTEKIVIKWEVTHSTQGLRKELLGTGDPKKVLMNNRHFDVRNLPEGWNEYKIIGFHTVGGSDSFREMQIQLIDKNELAIYVTPVHPQATFTPGKGDPTVISITIQAYGMKKADVQKAAQSVVTREISGK